MTRTRLNLFLFLVVKGVDFLKNHLVKGKAEAQKGIDLAKAEKEKLDNHIELSSCSMIKADRLLEKLKVFN